LRHVRSPGFAVQMTEARVRRAALPTTSTYAAAAQACQTERDARITPVESAAKAPRSYRGVAPSERRAQRRERFLEAGLELFGTRGYASTSIREVSAVAALNSRYFYESFTSREDLLYCVYVRIVRDIAMRAAAEVAEAGTIEDKARAGLRVGWTTLTEDPRKARIVALEVVGVSDRLERLRRDTRHTLANLTVQGALSVAPKDLELRLDPVLTARALMGGVVEVLADWINGDVNASVDEVVEHFTQLFAAAASAAAAPAQEKRKRPARSNSRPAPGRTR
jgi:AcrR family transcriptional regulator